MKIRLSEILKSLRREKGNTQEELAQYLGISPQSVSKWEREEGYPDIALLPEIAGYYRVSVDCLLGVDERAKEARVKEITDRYNALRRHIPMDKNIVWMKELRFYANPYARSRAISFWSSFWPRICPGRERGAPMKRRESFSSEKQPSCARTLWPVARRIVTAPVPVRSY